MAQTDFTVHIDTSEQAKHFLARLEEMREVLSEERIRQIVQEELAAWEKRQVQRARFGDQFERK